MAESEFRESRPETSVQSALAERLCHWNRDDRETFSSLVSRLKIGQNHQRDLMDWLEEIALRDTAKIADVLGAAPLAAIESDPRLGRADKLKRIKEHIRRLRFPRLTASEDGVRSRLRELKLVPELRITVPAGLEGGKLHVEFSAANMAEFRVCVSKLADAADREPLSQAFAILSGQSSEEICGGGGGNRPS